MALRLDTEGTVDVGFKNVPRPWGPTEHLLRDCFALGAPTSRPPALMRLELALGPELAHRLVATLTVGSRG